MGKLCSSSPLVNATDDPIPTLLTTINNNLNLSSSVFFLNYHTKDSNSTTSGSNSYDNSLTCPEATTSSSLTFMVQWQTNTSTTSSTQESVIHLLQSPDFLSQIQHKWTGVCSIKTGYLDGGAAVVVHGASRSGTGGGGRRELMTATSDDDVSEVSKVK